MKFFNVLLYFSTYTIFILLPFVIFFYEPMSGKQWIYLIAAGVFATVGQFSITVAYKFAPAKQISIFFYSTVVYSVLISIILFGQIPDLWSVVFYVAIFCALMYMFLNNNR